MKARDAIAATEKHGILLVYPIKNKKDPRSLWSVFYPRSEMVWDWEADSDNRVAELWFMREELSRSKKVIYGKWFSGRAVFFSKSVFVDLLSISLHSSEKNLSREAKKVLDILRFESPQSTKQLKRQTELVGRALEPLYNKALKELWNRNLIVAFGEVDEGAFPSLALGATELLFEELYRKAEEQDPQEALARLQKRFADEPAIKKYLQRVSKV